MGIYCPESLLQRSRNKPQLEICHKTSKNSKTLTSLVSKTIMISYRVNRALFQCSFLFPKRFYLTWFEEAPGTTQVPLRTFISIHSEIMEKRREH